MSEPQSRSSRAAFQRDRRRLVLGGIVALSVVIGLGVIALALAARPAPPIASAPGQVSEDSPATLTLFALRDDPPMATVVGTATGRDAVAMPLPSDVVIPLPEVGSGTVGDAIANSGEVGRTAIANLLGAWIPHYAEVDLDGLSRVVDRSGGISVIVPRVHLGERTVGPGPVTMRGADVVMYLSIRDLDERALRWSEVSAGLFAQPLDIDERSLVASDDAKAAATAFGRIHAATVVPFPAEAISIGLQQAQPEAIQAAIADAFGIVHGVPSRIIVMDGLDDCYGCGQRVTEAVVPLGYRVSAYGRDGGKSQARTMILAANRDVVPQAEQIAKALGVGRVLLSKESSGLGDITVIVGQDFLEETV